MQRTMAIATAVCLVVVSTACAGSEANRRDEAEVQEEAPEEEPEGEVPEGPEVKVDGDIEREGESGDRERAKSSETSGEANRGEERASSGEAATVTPAEIRTFREKGPSYIFRVVKLEPYRVDGDFKGYEVVGAAASAEEIMTPQVQVGDVVTHVNDVRIARPKHYMEVWKNLDDVDRVRVRLVRDGDEEQAVWRIVDEE